MKTRHCFAAVALLAIALPPVSRAQDPSPDRLTVQAQDAPPRGAQIQSSNPSSGVAPAALYECAEQPALARLASPLAHMARRLAAEEPVTIMALGSSSTAGAGASGPAASYPNQLEADLRARFPDATIRVINRGVNGDEAAEMLARFDKVAPGDKPDVILWQVGTNAVLRDESLGPLDALIQDGLSRMKALNADIVLIDPQFAPKVISKADAPDMVALIAAAATRRGVDLFPRFAIMREWREHDAIPFEAFLSPDQLHMNDWGYACVAKLLGAAMADAATRPAATARVAPR